MSDKPCQIPDNIIDDAKRLINICSTEFEQPTEALFAAILVVAVIAKGAGMPLQTLLDGVASAYSDLDPMVLDVGAKPRGTH
jgi:hypothetical protein